MCIINNATMQAGNSTHKYIGLTEGTFKKRYNGHTDSFRNVERRTSTELSKKVWQVKNTDPNWNWSDNISWRVIQKYRVQTAHPYKGECNMLHLRVTRYSCV